VAYPGVYHDLNAPNGAVKVRIGAATAVGGIVHVGTNEPELEDALTRLPKWLEKPRLDSTLRTGGKKITPLLMMHRFVTNH
jgi:hypothetical protein